MELALLFPARFPGPADLESCAERLLFKGCRTYNRSYKHYRYIRMRRVLFFKDDCDFWDFLFIIRSISYGRANARDHFTTADIVRAYTVVCIIFCVIYSIRMFVFH